MFGGRRDRAPNGVNPSLEARRELPGRRHVDGATWESMVILIGDWGGVKRSAVGASIHECAS